MLRVLERVRELRRSGVDPVTSLGNSVLRTRVTTVVGCIVVCAVGLLLLRDRVRRLAVRLLLLHRCTVVGSTLVEGNALHVTLISALFVISGILRSDAFIIIVIIATLAVKVNDESNDQKEGKYDTGNDTRNGGRAQAVLLVFITSILVRACSR